MAKQLSHKELSAFFGQLALIIRSGISLQEGISMVIDEVGDTPSHKELYGAILEASAKGLPLSDAFEATHYLPNYATQMVRLGEDSGRLDEVLHSLSEYYEQNAVLRDSIRTAVTYPAIIVAMMALVIVVLIIKVLPIFNDIFIQLGGESTRTVQNLINVGNVISNIALYIVGAILLIVIALYLINRSKRGRDALSGLYQKMFRKTYRLIAAGRFASVLSMMLSSGMDTDSAIEMAEQMIEDKPSREKLAALKADLQKGLPFAEAVANANIFTGLEAHMIAIGTRGGTTDAVMAQLASQYETRTQEHISTLVSIIEPSMVAVLSIIIGLILLSVMLPLMGIMAAIG